MVSVLKEDGRDITKLEAALRHVKEKLSDFRTEERKKVIICMHEYIYCIGLSYSLGPDFPYLG